MATAVACTSAPPPTLSGLTDQVAQVGTELKIELDGATTSSAHLSYRYHVADLTDLTNNAQITTSPNNTGVFRWTPLAADLGAHSFDFTVSDGSNDTTVTINIDVKSAIGSASAPIFRQPLGTGTTVDLSVTPCVDLDVVVDDQVNAMLTIAQEDPVIDGATLTPVDGQSAKWHWCPTRDQQTDNRYTLILSADDGQNPKTIKNYLIVLRGTPGGSSCPGAGPSISHIAMDQTTRLDLTPTASITDALGLKDTPLVYYSATDPGATADVTMMTQLSAHSVSGDNNNGTWTAAIPNPVASMPDGATATIYYVFVADDFDTTNNCDHTAQSPTYKMTVTAGGSQTAGLCQPCSADAQCGTGNECVAMGSFGASYCLSSCDAGCGSGYTCSNSGIFSVDGASANQCVPQSGSCEAPTGACQDDTWEANDSRSEASSNPTMSTGLYDLVSCPSTTSTTRANDDWYKIVTTGGSRVDLQLSGDGATDLDLHLYHSDGTVVTASTSSTPNEEINTCLTGATYYVKVNGYGHARSEYLLSYDSKPETCNTTCVDDSHEDDDTFSQARATTYPNYSSTGNMICPNDDDWFHVQLFANDTMTIDLTFTQTTEAQDLDLHLYQDSVDLWPCSPADPSMCSAAHGQGAVSNEHAVFTAPANCTAGCDYYVVVRGWDGASNSYGISIGVQ